ncbi:hypothetical protein Hypma_005616 [Hypsizygus marmoreus]|uniref:Uncharacterized protein n=1 Tax=Hypsizygus marmoreus TaxID=39966 RepID=A0A369K1Q7_HYPMA|nr:hypothetical protein Hypma_005616 [Hypsizygus marmoreus]
MFDSLMRACISKEDSSLFRVLFLRISNLPTRHSSSITTIIPSSGEVIKTHADTDDVSKAVIEVLLQGVRVQSIALLDATFMLMVLEPRRGGWRHDATGRVFELAVRRGGGGVGMTGKLGWTTVDDGERGRWRIGCLRVPRPTSSNSPARRLARRGNKHAGLTLRGWEFFMRYCYLRRIMS